MRSRHIAPSAWQLDAIDHLDATRMRVYFEDSEKKQPKAEVSERPLTSRLFEALFPQKVR